MKKNKQLPLDHPLRQAKWIWPLGQMYIYNTYAAFRKDFDVEKTDSAKIYISADQAYKLYINGKYVCRGPARGYQNHWPFDEADVSGFLRKGHNWISVQAYNPGIGTFQYRHESSAGMICALDLGRKLIVSDESWCRRRITELHRNTARYSLQLSFQEHVNAAKLDNSWIADENPDLNWKNSEDEKLIYNDVFAYGLSPYDTMEERGIPFLHEEYAAFEKIICTASGKCEKDYQKWENVSWGWVREAQKVKQWNCFSEHSNRSSNAGIVNETDKVGRSDPRPPSDNSVISEDKFKSLRLSPTGKDCYISYAIDAGEYLVGALGVEIEGSTGKEIIDFQFHENMVGERPAIRPEGSGCQIALANRIFLSDKKIKHEFFHPLGFRYFSVIVRNSEEPIDIKIRIRKVHYPFTMRGNFDCSDSNLKEIFEICRRTQQICSLDAYVDTPWREQAQWWGDARVQAHNTFYLDGDPKLLIRGIKSIAGQSTLQGLTYGHAPTIAYNCILPDFSLTWIMTFWDLYWQTENVELFKDYWERIKEILEYFDSEDAKHETGLIKYDVRYWYFGDWADIYRAGIPTYLNIWYLYTLQHLIRLLDKAEMNKEKALYSKKCEKHKKLILKYLYNSEKCEFCGGLDNNLNKVEKNSVHDHMIAVLTGLIPEKNEIFYKKWILPYLKMEKQNAATPSVFWSSYVLEEAGKSGYEKEVINFIKTKWTPMLQTGTTWEQFTWSEKENETASHAWAAHPSYHFTNIITGIRQEAEGWKKISIKPNFNLGINESCSIVPSPKGDIKVSWKIESGEYTLDIEIPENVNAEIILPDARLEIKGNIKKQLKGLI